MPSSRDLSDPVVREAVAAIRRGDRDGLLCLFTPGAVLTDDGSAENLGVWVDREIVDAEGRLFVEREANDGRTLVGRFRSQLYDLMTEWRFVVAQGRIERLDVRALDTDHN